MPGWEATIPFVTGAQEIIAWYDEDPARQVVDPERNAVWDALIKHARG